MAVKITGDWVEGCIRIPYTSLSFGPFAPGQPKWIVLHGSASGPGSTGVAMATSWQNLARVGLANVSAHCFIEKDGTIVQGLSFKQTAWANCCLEPGHKPFFDPGNQNFTTLSIEHVKYDAVGNTDPITPAQSVSSFYLIKALCEAYGIPKEVVDIGDASKGGIVGHKDIMAVTRPFCPGPYPWADLQRLLKSDSNSGTGSTSGSTTGVTSGTSLSSNSGCNPIRSSTS